MWARHANRGVTFKSIAALGRRSMARPLPARWPDGFCWEVSAGRTIGSMARLLPYRLDGPTAAQSHYRLDGPIAAVRTTGSMARLLLIPATDSMARWRVFGSMALLLDSIRTTDSMARLLPYRLDGPMASSPHLGLDGPFVFSRPGSNNFLPSAPPRGGQCPNG